MVVQAAQQRGPAFKREVVHSNCSNTRRGTGAWRTTVKPGATRELKLPSHVQHVEESSDSRGGEESQDQGQEEKAHMAPPLAVRAWKQQLF